MINAYINTPVVVAAGETIPFASSRARSNSSCACNGGWLLHQDGSGIFTINKPGRYLVQFGATVTSTVAGPVSVALRLNGENIPGTVMGETIAAADDEANISRAIIVEVPCYTSFVVAAANVGEDEITINSASMLIARLS
ncbi:MAG: hypothetical protein J6V52_05210 [Bacteroidaceae bacterium]|nr:hypothetical protein [Bacteroidaceae bacterium]